VPDNQRLIFLPHMRLYAYLTLYAPIFPHQYKENEAEGAVLLRD
jgi:hypothetical protein